MSSKYYVLSFGEWNMYEGSERTYHLNKILNRIEKEIYALNPAGIIIPIMTEIAGDWICGEAIRRLYNWCRKKNKYIYVLSAAYSHNFPLHNFKHVIFKKFDGYDIVNFFTIENYYKDKKPVLLYPNKLLTCYNNKSKRHRDYTVDQLLYHRLAEWKGIVTYNSENLDNLKHYIGDEYFSLNDEPNFKLHETHTPNDVPWRYLTGLIDIVTESTFEHNEFFLTEKTARPLMTQKPFLVVGPQGYHKYLESKGIKLYDEIFDYSFDDEPELEKRIDGLLENFLQLREQYTTVADFKELLSLVKPKLESNLNAYLEHCASGAGFHDNPFPWLLEADISDYVEYQIKGGEFDMLHNFMHNVVAKYRAGDYQLPDVHYIPESFYLVDFQHADKFSELWENHPIRPEIYDYSQSHKFNHELCQIHPHDEREVRMISCIVDHIEKVNPDKVLIFSGSEMDVDLIYGELWHMLGNWCRTQNKKIHVFVTAVPLNMYPPEYVELHKFVQTYDVANLTTIIDFYGGNCQPPKERVRKPPKFFTCYNSRLANYRTYIIDQLAKHNLLENSVTTYRLAIDNPRFDTDQWLYYDGTPILIDEEDYPNCDPKYHGMPKSYQDGCLDIVTETRIDPCTWYMSEKTGRAVALMKPFLVLSSPGYHQWLEHKGIQKFDEIFDYSFDDKEDYKERARGIVKNIINLNKKYKTPEDYEKLLEMMKPKLKQNLINYIEHVQTGQSILPHLPDWLDYTRLTEIAGGDIRRCGDYPSHHYGTLGLDISGEVMPIIHLTGRIDDLREGHSGDWKKEIDQMGFSMYQYILNL